MFDVVRRFRPECSSALCLLYLGLRLFLLWQSHFNDECIIKNTLAMLLYRAHFWSELLVGVLFFALSICLVVRLNREIFFLYCFVFLSIVIACCPCIIATKLDFKVLCISIGQFFIVKFVLCFALICTLRKLRFVSR